MRGTTIAVSILLLGVPAEASGYVRAASATSGVPLQWKGRSCVRLRASSHGIGEGSDKSELQAIARAAASWDRATSGCSYLRLILLEPQPDVSVDLGERPAQELGVSWVSSQWQSDAAHTLDTVALTSLWYVDRAGDSEDGTIVAAYLELNNEIFAWTTRGEDGCFDVENTVSHELGHVLGLDHPCYLGAYPMVAKDDKGQPVPACSQTESRTILDSAMYPSTHPGDISRRAPSADDVAGVCAGYPVSADPKRCESSGPSAAGYAVARSVSDEGGCAVSAAGSGLQRGPIGAAVLLMALALAARRRRGR